MTPEPDAGPPLRNADLAALGDELVRLQHRRTAVYAGVVLEASAWRILRVLADGEPRSLRMLAADLDLEQSTVNRQVNAAIGAGYLERFEVPGSVSRLVRPSARGREAYEHDGRIRASLIQTALDEMGPERSAGLIADLRAFNDAWDRAIAARAEG
ncbi:MarR family winged helix-turn-helix transcriptional regulator [Nocardioides dongxiaopingii]|nr:MarR family winged helix-turn-helix transcriptional regulator [Nocardioides dongxiaopingii]